VCTLNTKELLINEIKEIPEPLLGELLDFAIFLKSKLTREKFNITMMSETSLGKDWLRPEEDEAWQDL
jgi:hypothetical protein